MRDALDPRLQNRYWRGADLVLEVVSPDQPARDLVVKRGDYAAARIPEYWIVDPRVGTITVLRLEGAVYVEHGVFGRGARATSTLLTGLRSTSPPCSMLGRHEKRPSGPRQRAGSSPSRSP